MDAPHESGYDTNWASLRERVALSQTRSKEEFARLKAIENRPETEQAKGTTVWNAVSRREVTKRDIENRCKRYADEAKQKQEAVKQEHQLVKLKEDVVSGGCSIPRPSLRRRGSGAVDRQRPATPEREMDGRPRSEERKTTRGAIDDAKNLKNLAPLCGRCAQAVYPKELMEARKGAAFHERCFRCETCDLKLSLKTFAANPRDPGDARVYCKNHAPQLDAARVDHTARDIAGCRRAPKAQAVFNGQVRGPDAGKAVKYDTSALGIQAALNAPRLSERVSHLPPPPDVIKSDVIGLRYF